jgi:flagellar basal body-associated protein FliL
MYVAPFAGVAAVCQCIIIIIVIVLIIISSSITMTMTITTTTEFWPCLAFSQCKTLIGHFPPQPTDPTKAKEQPAPQRVHLYSRDRLP